MAAAASGRASKGCWAASAAWSRKARQSKVQADTAYLIRAIREPNAEVVEGYPPAMPPYPGLSDDEIKAVQAWLETLK